MEAVIPNVSDYRFS